MATRIIETINSTEDMNNEGKLTKLKTMRRTVKAQLTKVNKHLIKGQCEITEATVRLQNIHELRTKFDMLQDHIELLSSGEHLEAELLYREEIEEALTAAKTHLQNIISASSNYSNTRHNSNEGNHHTSTNATSNISFMQYDERESFQNFTRRLNTFMVLKGITDQKQKTMTFLHALTPLIYHKLYDICAPENPMDKKYEEVVDILV